MRYVICWGYVYALTNKKYRRMLEELKKGEGVTMQDYGKQMGLTINVTDMLPEEAETCLKDLDADDLKVVEERRRKKDRRFK